MYSVHRIGIYEYANYAYPYMYIVYPWLSMCKSVDVDVDTVWM